jgi:hypothetical protein
VRDLVFRQDTQPDGFVAIWRLASDSHGPRVLLCLLFLVRCHGWLRFGRQFQQLDLDLPPLR